MRSYFEQISNKRLKINLLVLAHIGLPLYSISDNKIRPHLFFNPPLKKLSTPTTSLNPHLQKLSIPTSILRIRSLPTIYTNVIASFYYSEQVTTLWQMFSGHSQKLDYL